MSMREVAFKDLALAPKFQVIEFSPAYSERWDDFVQHADNGTIFHTRKFLNYHPPERFLDNSLIITKDDRWVAVLPAAKNQNDAKKQLVSHPGASFGGPVAQSPLSIKDAFHLVEAIGDYAHERAFSEIVMTLPPQIYCNRPNNYLDFALLETGFAYRKREVSSMLPLDFAEEDTLLKFSPTSRRAVRKAEKLGVQVRESDDWSRFYAILERNLQLRHNVMPTHTLQELLVLKRIFPEHIRLFAAYKDDDMVAGTVIFVCNDRVGLAFYISHDETLQQYRGVNMLFYEVIRWSIRRQLRFLDFGIFTVNMKPNWGLARFKESFGALGIFRDTFVKRVGT